MQCKSDECSSGFQQEVAQVKARWNNINSK